MRCTAGSYKIHWDGFWQLQNLFSFVIRFSIQKIEKSGFDKVENKVSLVFHSNSNALLIL